RGNANRPLTKQGKAKRPTPERQRQKEQTPKPAEQAPTKPFYKHGNRRAICTKPKPLPKCPIARKRPKHQMNRK
ncbi:MAG: hypothetical protein OSB38_44085, partial [Paraburkholderia fungorum]|nr:hypothetical protein [Paraburkholderia fungorum]